MGQLPDNGASDGGVPDGEAPDGEAIVYCEGAFHTTDGKTAHGLVRFTRRYTVKAVIDSTAAGRDAGEILDGIPNGIPIARSLEEALAHFSPGARKYFVVGLAVVGGRFQPAQMLVIQSAVRAGCNVDSGLHDFLSEDRELIRLATECGVTLRDVRKIPPRNELRAYTGKISEVTSLRVAVLGTDSAVGKRTTAWKIIEGFEARGISAEMVGTGQTAWMQGARYTVMLDSMINDFLAGELEHAVWSAWAEKSPRVIVIEGQGGLLNPAFPGGYEILAATRPDVVVLQHAPSRVHYEDFPQFPIHSLQHQLLAIKVISSKPVTAITINHERVPDSDIASVCGRLEEETGLPCIDVLKEGPGRLIDVLVPYLYGTDCAPTTPEGSS